MVVTSRIPFRLKALGSLVVEGSAGPLIGAAAQRRTLALLILIATARNRGISRDKLLGLLWPDVDEERARHALAQTLYRLRREFGLDAVEGTDVLRLSALAFTVDATEFEEAIGADDLKRAAQLYAGPFLDGFFLPGESAFDQWVEAERARLAGMHRALLERLATEAARKGDRRGATRWWVALAAADPLNSRVAAHLVQALALAGDRAGALQYARIHETLVRQELDTIPGAEFTVAVTAARDDAFDMARALEGAAPQSVSMSGVAGPKPDGATPSEHPRSSSSTSGTFRVAISRRALRRVVAAVGAGVATLAVVAYVRLDMRHSAQSGVPVIAVGHIADYSGGEAGVLASVLPEMLTTNLSRLAGLSVVSRARLHELMPPDGKSSSAPSDERAFARAGQLAGADQLLDGALYRRPDGLLRLDVRVMELRTGRVQRVHQVEARDAFALADSATVQIAFGFAVPLTGKLRVSDVTTTSLVAFQLYEEGQRAHRQFDPGGARRLFDAALVADSGFAMAAYGAYRATGDFAYLRRALRLMDRATDRERLVIRANWAVAVNHPSQVAVAETLAARYAADPESQLMLANALFWQGDFASAIVAARQAFAMDSLTLRANAPRCLACEALAITVSAHRNMDSVARAEDVSRQWVARQPSSPLAWTTLREVLTSRDDSAGALAANDSARARSSGPFDDWPWVVSLSIRTGDFAKADRLLARFVESGTAYERERALWWRAIGQRHRGLLRDALVTTRRMVRAPHSLGLHLLHGQVLFELGRYRDAAAAFDSAARLAAAVEGGPSARARHEGWALTHKAAALAAAGEVDAHDVLADSVRAFGLRSGYGRDHGLHHHIRGLQLAARGRKDEAVTEFRRAIWSPVAGYTRTNFELGRLLIELDRPRESIPMLRAALHGGLEASNMYVTHTEIRALLARAYAATNNADSSLVHRRWVENAMKDADPAARARIDRLLFGT